MKKRAMRYLSGAFFISTVPTLVGTQQVSAEGGNPATPEQQKEIVDYCYKEVQKYWEIHDPVLAIRKIATSVTMPDNPNTPDAIDLAYEEYFQDKSLRTFDNELKLAEKLYQDALKDHHKKWDCKVVSGHMSNYLTSMGIKHVYIRFILPNKNVGHAAIMYAVNEPSEFDPNKIEEKWYVLDMSRVVQMVLTKIPNPDKEVYDELWALDNQKTTKEAKDAARIPLVDYAAWKYGFQNTPIVYVVDSFSTQSLRPKTWVPYDALSLGDYLVKNSPVFAMEYLIFEAAGIDRENLMKNSKGELVLKSRRWLKEIEVQPRPSFCRTFRMEVTVNGRRMSAPGCTIPYDEGIFFAWMQKNSEVQN